MEEGKLLFVYNPNAGKGIIKKHLSDIIEMFCQNNYVVTVYATQKEGDAAKIVKENGDCYDRVVCCGGDGTLNDVTDGMMHLDNRPLCGYIPAGTVNDFAHSFKLPQNMLDAAHVAIDGESCMCDVGELNGDYFDYIAAFGAFTDVSYETPQVSKNILGKLAYFLEGVKKLGSIRKYDVTVTIEDEVISDKLIYGMITNSFSVAGFLSLFDDDVALDDGYLEAFFIKAPKNIMEFQLIINALLSGNVNCELFYYRHIKRIEIECETPLKWTVDGEFGGEYTKAVIVNHKGAIPFVRGKS
ncbi:MAG: YegS/Rv2252/BmrU family lipid kinase [Lachnospiraceae bacterium]|nr:YegS/Rv2252/BmrU family lipid kinase [Lachnospiraceae bacterium]